MHSPVWMKNSDRTTSKAFKKQAREDIEAVIELLYKRGMWSKFHYEKWMAELDNYDEMMLHEHWDAIVNGAMYEEDTEEVKEMGMEEGLACRMKSQR